MSEAVRLRIPDGSGAQLELEALFEPARGAAVGAAVVAPPHPLYGGLMDNPVVDALALGLRRAGYDALRFNYRGCGESAGEPSGDPRDGDADYAAALGWLADRRPGLLCAAGYSFGAACALRALGRQPPIARAVVVAPPVSMLSLDSWAAFAGDVQLLVGDDDAYAPLGRLQHALRARAGVQLHVVGGADHFFSRGTSLLLAQVELAAR